MIPAASYKALQQDRSACVADCTQGSTALALPLQYYWNASAWQPCPVACDGGFQTRDVACVNSVDNRCSPAAGQRRLRQGPAASLTGSQVALSRLLQEACTAHLTPTSQASPDTRCKTHRLVSAQPGGRVPVRGSCQACGPQGLWLDPLPGGFRGARPAAGALGCL